MLRLPAVAGQFYPSNPRELAKLVQNYLNIEPPRAKVNVRACLVPHAGYIYSGGVVGAVFARIALPKKILLLGVRHAPPGETLAILSEGAWRTPLGDVPIDTPLAMRLRTACPLLREDSVAHSREHSLEVELPFLQFLAPHFSFVPVALGTLQYSELLELGQAIAQVFAALDEEILIVTSSDMNHYENDQITRRKDSQAMECMRNLDAKALYDVCREEKISMCGLGPAVTMLTAMKLLGAEKGEIVRYSTSGEVNGEKDSVVGYAGMLFL